MKLAIAFATGAGIMLAISLIPTGSRLTCYEDEARIQWGGREVCEPVDNLPLATQQGVNW